MGSVEHPRHVSVFAHLRRSDLPVLLALPLLVWINVSANHLALPAHWFLSFHSSIEVLSVVLSAGVFITGWYLHPSRGGTSSLLACAFLVAAMLDLVHLLSYPGMVEFITPNTPHKALVFWFGARYAVAIAVLTFVVVPPAAGREGRGLVWMAVGGIWMIAVLMIGNRQPGWLPATYDPDRGITGFKLALEAGVAVLLATALAVRYMRANLSPESRAHEKGGRELAQGLLLLLAGQAFFMSYSHPSDVGNGIGHIYKAFGYAALYRMMLLCSVREPVRRLRAALRSAEEISRRYQRLLKDAPDAILMLDDDGRITNCNASAERLFDYEREALIGSRIEMLIPERFRAHHPGHRAHFSQAVGSRPMSALRGIVARQRDGSEIAVDVALSAEVAGDDVRIMAFVRDMRAREQLEQTLLHQARHDALTGLPNRSHFCRVLEQTIASANDRYRAAVILMDLDNFNTINDSWGHQQGDQLLALVAQRLTEAMPAGAMLARMGGDEFGMLLPHVSGTRTMEVAENLLSVVGRPFEVGQHRLFSSVSVGVSLFPGDAADATTLLRRADLALLRAKSGGRGRVIPYGRDLEVRANNNLELQSLLHDALAQDQFQLHYQPQVSFHNGRVCGLEALLRWPHPQRGMIDPNEFIPVAEASGMIIPIGNWVIDAACRQISGLRRSGINVRVAINLSAHQLHQGDLVDRIDAALRHHSVPANSLQIELTESAMMEDPVAAAATLRQLSAKGISVAVDDFGTGYSSLAYLKDFPLNKLKIDRGFISDLDGSHNAVAIVRGLIGLAHSLGLTVLAEGVETEAQRQFLVEFGCDEYQGWLFSRALPSDGLIPFLLAHTRGEAPGELKP